MGYWHCKNDLFECIVKLFLRAMYLLNLFLYLQYYFSFF
jgi:hypothetical protein